MMFNGTMTYMDLAVLILAAVFLLIGLSQGLAKQLLSLFGIVFVIAVSILLCVHVAALISPMFRPWLESSFTTLMQNKDAAVAEGDKIFTVEKDWTDDGNVNAALTALGLPAFLSGILYGTVSGIFADFGTAKLIDVFPPVLAGWALTAISFLALVIILGVLVIVIKRLILKFASLPSVKDWDRILGMLLSLVKLYLGVSATLALILTTFASVSFLSPVQNFLIWQADLSQAGKVPVFSFLVNHNFIGEWLIKIIVSYAVK